jgi:uncharacterized protein (TIGR00299 family) protein
MRILYLDPFSGVSGDMFLGALLDLGLDLERLKTELAKLPLGDYGLCAERVKRGTLQGVKFDVDEDDDHHGHSHDHDHGHGDDHDHGAHRHLTPADYAGTTVWAGHASLHQHRTFASIKTMLEQSVLSPRAKADSLRVFTRLAEAEGRVHDMPIERVAFHEVGALDSIVDIVGACIGLELLGVDELWCGPVALGSGTVQCAHGLLPVPAPATLELVKGLPTRPSPVEKELTTPTGAALVATLAAHFGPLPEMTIEKTGYGAGGRDNPAVPNVLRAVLGTVASAADPQSAIRDPEFADTIVEIRTNLDDISPEALGHAVDLLLAQGALDVFFTPIQMKKSRPAMMLTVLAEPQQLAALATILFKETGTFGLRYQTLSRLKLAREMVSVQTEYGPVRVKVGRWQGDVVAVHPEFEDCKARAEGKGVPVRAVMDAARAAYRPGAGAS